MHSHVPHSLQGSVPTGLNPARSPHRRDQSAFPQDAPLISDFRHPIIRRIADLRDRRGRECSGLYFGEGLRFVFRAVQQQATLEALLVCRKQLTQAYAQRLVRRQRQLGVPILEVAPRVLHELATADDPQGIGAVVRQRWEDVEQVAPGEELCWIALQTVRSAGNLGTILRTSEAVGGAGIILLGHAVDPYAPAVVRASMGSIHSQRMVRTTVTALAKWKQRHRCVLIGTSPTAPTDYHRIDYRTPTVLLMGEERRGLPMDLIALCDQMVHIPMVGDTDSLNVGVATGVMLYELFNQRRAT